MEKYRVNFVFESLLELSAPKILMLRSNWLQAQAAAALFAIGLLWSKICSEETVDLNIELSCYWLEGRSTTNDGTY